METHSTNDATRISLSNDEAEEVTQYLVQVCASALPLAAGLRAAAAETRSRRVSTALTTLSDGLEQGRTLDQILTTTSLLPGYVAGLVATASRSGRLGEALADLMEHRREMQELRHDVWRGFAYPLVVCGLTVLVMLLVLFGITPIFQNMIREFELKPPVLTGLLFWCRDVGIWILAGAAAIAIVAALIFRGRMGSPAVGRAIASAPLFGPVWHWMNIAEWSSLLSVLIRHGVPVPDALQVSSAALAHDYMRELSRRLADGAGSGQPLSRLISVLPDFPRALTPLIAWGESKNLLAEAFEDSRHWLARRVQLRAAMLQAIVPPLLFVIVGACVMFVVGGLFMPIFALIRGLS